MKKQELRRELLERRNRLSAEERKEKSRKILEQIQRREVYQHAERIFIYVSVGSEVETHALIEQTWKDGKMVAVPKMDAERKMYFLPFVSFSELKKHKFGVYEPQGSEAEALIPQKGDLFLVPVVGFDRNKNRMGYGGGYYDRYFAKHREIYKIGLAFAMQMQEIPTEETDIPMDEILTENGVIV